MSDNIEVTIELDAPIGRVWAALTDHRRFGDWFRVKLDKPFVVGGDTTGRITAPGFEGYPWRVAVREMDAPRRFSFAWHPHAVDHDTDYANEPMTLVEFTLEHLGEKTRLTVVESGFDALPQARRWIAIRENEIGWKIQSQNIAAYVES